MSGDDEERVVTTTSGGSSTPQVLPELQPFVQRLGQLALNFLGDPNIALSSFTQGAGLTVPGLTPVEMLAQQQIADRALYGIPTPPSEFMASQYASELPWFTGQQVPVSPNTYAGLGIAQQIAAQGQNMLPMTLSGIEGLQSSMGVNPITQLGITGLEQFTSPSAFGTSDAVQNALAGIRSQIQPQIENTMAKAGLSQSGFLPGEIGRAYAQELVPLYMQGLQQSQSAAGQLMQGGLSQSGLQAGAGAQLMTGGTNILEQQLRSLQNLRDSYIAVGNTEQALRTDAAARQLQATMAMVPELRQIGMQEYQRPIEAIKEAMTAGEQQRQINLAQNQALLDSYLRNREMALAYTNPFAVSGGGSSGPSRTETNREISGGGWSFGK